MPSPTTAKPASPTPTAAAIRAACVLHVARVNGRIDPRVFKLDLVAECQDWPTETQAAIAADARAIDTATGLPDMLALLRLAASIIRSEYPKEDERYQVARDIHAALATASRSEDPDTVKPGAARAAIPSFDTFKQSLHALEAQSARNGAKEGEGYSALDADTQARIAKLAALGRHAGDSEIRAYWLAYSLAARLSDTVTP